MQKTFHVKIVPPSGAAVYRLAFTRTHLAALALAVVAAIAAGLGLHARQLAAAQADVRALEGRAAAQQAQLRTLDAQADRLSEQLRSVQRENAEIQRLIGGGRGAKRQHSLAVPHPGRAARGDGFARVGARLRGLARASEATSVDAGRLQHAVLRVLNLRRLAWIARRQMIARIPSIAPVPGATLAARYGWRTDPWPEFHQGVDLAADEGTPVRAAADGTVVSAGWDDGGFGNRIEIDHGNGYRTWYCHLSRVGVSVGERVTKGTSIASVGSTGESTGPHLHYQVMKDGKPIDPQPFLSGVPGGAVATLPDPERV